MFQQRRCFCITIFFITTVSYCTGDPSLPASLPQQEPILQESANATKKTKLIELRDAGDEAYGNNLYDLAEKMYRLYLEESSQKEDVFEATIRLVRTQIYLEKFTDALSVLEKAQAKIATESDTSNHDFIAITVLWKGRVLFLQSNTEEAIKAYKKVTATSSYLHIKIQALLALGDCYIKQENWQKATSILEDILRIQDSSLIYQEEALYKLIVVAILNGNFEEAEQKIIFLKEQAKGNFRIHLDILQIAIFLGRKNVTAAYDYYQKTLLKRADYLNDAFHYTVLRQLGLALFDEEKGEDGQIIFERILPLLRNEGKKKKIILDLAQQTARVGRYETAISYYKNYLDLYGDELQKPIIQFQIAKILVKKEQWDEALFYYQDVYDNDKYSSVLLRYQAAFSIAEIYKSHKRNIEKAVKYFFETSKLDVSEEEKAKGIFLAAELYFSLEDYSNAAIHYQIITDSYKESSFVQKAYFKQAKSRYKGKHFPVVVEILNQYLTRWEEGEYSQEALFIKGMAERNARNYSQAIDTLKTFATTYPDSENAPQALLAASQAAMAADLQPDALRLLTTIVTDYKNSRYYPYALYSQAYLRLSYGIYQEAQKDGFSFVEKFSQSYPKLAADVYLWLGDYYTSVQDYSRAEMLFMEVVTKYEGVSKEVPSALYQAAKCSYYLSKRDGKNYSQSIEYIDRLLLFSDIPPRIVAQANYLRGDIASIKGDFTDAIQWFEKCSELVPRTELYYAAIGRLGECYYSIATIQGEHSSESTEKLQKALSYFITIINEEHVTESSVEIARYRAGKIYELLHQRDNAKEEYFTIFFRYNQNVKNNKIFSWYYFSRSGFDLAKMYEEDQEYTSAKIIYNRIANANIPLSEDAKMYAKRIDERYLVR